MKYKKILGGFTFELINSDYEDDCKALFIKRGKAEIKMDLPTAFSENPTMLEKIVKRFVYDIDFRSRATRLSEPLKGYGYLDVDFIREYYPESELNHLAKRLPPTMPIVDPNEIPKQIQILIEKEKASESGRAGHKDYLSLKSGLDKYSDMPLSELERSVPIEVLKEARTYPYIRLTIRFLRWYLRGLPLETLRNKMVVDRRYKIY